MRKTMTLALVSTLLIAACGGSGSSSSGGGTPTQGEKPNLLFVGEVRNNVIAAFDTLAPVGAEAVPGKVLTSEFSLRSGGQLDASRDLLYVGGATEVAVFANASALSGQIVPARKFRPKVEGGGSIGRLFLDSANDRIYVAHSSSGMSRGYLVFDKASTLSGDVTPSRFLRGPMDTSLAAFDFKRNVLYTKYSHLIDAEIYVMENVDKVDGALGVARRIRLGGNITALAIDSDRDRLYAILEGKGIAALNNASSKGAEDSHGKVTAAPVVAIPATSRVASQLAVDPRNDRLYVSSDSTHLIATPASALGEIDRPATIQLLSVGADITISRFAFP